MYERFTERARWTTILAQEEARKLGHGYIGTEHLLLGLIREEQGLAARVLENFGVSLEYVRAQTKALTPSGTTLDSSVQLPFTPRTKKVLELALREALSLGQNYIGTEHLLLGLTSEDQGVAMRMLNDKIGFPGDHAGNMIRTEIISLMPKATRPPAEVTLNDLQKAGRVAYDRLLHAASPDTANRGLALGTALDSISYLAQKAATYLRQRTPGE